MFEYPSALSPPPGPPSGEGGKPEPAWIGFVAVLILASPGFLVMGLILGVFYLCGGPSS